jgi:hypothetical protein
MKQLLFRSFKCTIWENEISSWDCSNQSFHLDPLQFSLFWGRCLSRAAKLSGISRSPIHVHFRILRIPLPLPRTFYLKFFSLLRLHFQVRRRVRNRGVPHGEMIGLKLHLSLMGHGSLRPFFFLLEKYSKVIISTHCDGKPHKVGYIERQGVRAWSTISTSRSFHWISLSGVAPHSCHMKRFYLPKRGDSRTKIWAKN